MNQTNSNQLTTNGAGGGGEGVIKPAKQPKDWSGAKAIWSKVVALLQVLISNVPLALISLPAAYGAARFSEKFYPSPWNIILGTAFESAYLGGIIFARSKGKKTFVLMIGVAAGCGIIYNFLNAAQIDGLLADWDKGGRWILAFIHGAPLSLLGVAYATLMHFSSDDDSSTKATNARQTNTTDSYTQDAIVVRKGLKAKGGPFSLIRDWLGLEEKIAEAVNQAQQTWKAEKAALKSSFETTLGQVNTAKEALSTQVNQLQNTLADWQKWAASTQTKSQEAQAAALNAQRQELEEQFARQLEAQRGQFETLLAQQIEQTQQAAQHQVAELQTRLHAFEQLSAANGRATRSSNYNENKNEDENTAGEALTPQASSRSYVYQPSFDDDGSADEGEEGSATTSAGAADSGSLAYKSADWYRVRYQNETVRARRIALLQQAYAVGHIKLKTIQSWVDRDRDRNPADGLVWGEISKEVSSASRLVLVAPGATQTETEVETDFSFEVEREVENGNEN